MRQHEIQYVDPMKLVPNPRNVKQHTDKQINLIMRSMDETGGSVVPIVVDENWGVLSGHGRLAASKRRGDLAVPVIRVEGLSEEKKLKFMLADNQLNAMTGNDSSALAELLQELDASKVPLADIGFSESELDKLLGYSAEDDADEMEEAGDESFSLYQLKERLDLTEEECVGPYCLPQLGIESIPEISDNITVWMNRHRTTDNGGDFLHMHGRESTKGLDPARTIIGFYIDDHRFEGVWSNLRSHTQRWLNAGVKAVIMPDFTRVEGWPLAQNLWNVYRNFYCALYWQEAGLQVIPNLTCWSIESIPGTSLPIPVGCNTVATQLQVIGGRQLRYSGQGQAHSASEDDVRLSLDLELDAVKPKTLLCYGSVRGLQIGETACRKHGVRFVGVENRANAAVRTFNDDPTGRF